MTDDYKFETAPMQIAVGTVKDGRAIVTAEDKPLIVTANVAGAASRRCFLAGARAVSLVEKPARVLVQTRRGAGMWYTSADFSNMADRAATEFSAR